jgi:hypothetical protein
MAKFVIYSNGQEAIVTTEKKEQEAIREVFGRSDRDIDHYVRSEWNDSHLFICPKWSCSNVCSLPLRTRDRCHDARERA